MSKDYVFGVDLAHPGSRDYSCAVQYERLPDGRYRFVRQVIVEPAEDVAESIRRKAMSEPMECPTPRCMEHRARYPQWPSRVVKRPTGVIEAPCCGGISKDDGATWVHACTRCKVPQTAGTLLTMLSGNFCRPCYDQRKATDRKCGICRCAMVDCTC